jgi:hypothetical protein
MASGELPIQADRAQRGGSSQLIVSDVVDLEGAAVDTPSASPTRRLTRRRSSRPRGLRFPASGSLRQTSPAPQREQRCWLFQRMTTPARRTPSSIY